MTMRNPIYLIVTPFFPSPKSWRGAYCYDFAQALRRIGKYRVEVFTGGDGADYEVDGMRVHTFRTRYLPSNIIPFLFARQNARSFLESVKRAGINFDEVIVCHGHTANYGIYPLVLKTRNPQCLTLLHHHDPQSFGLNLGRLRHCRMYTTFLFCQFRRMHEQIDCHVFVSEMSRQSFLQAPNTNRTHYGDYIAQMKGPRLFHCRSAQIRNSIVLHNGVDERIFSAGPISSCVGGKSSYTIGCIANFIGLKDQATLIRAVALAQEKFAPQGITLRIVFVGTGPLRVACENLAKELQVVAEFRTEVRHEKLFDLYRSFDLFVLPSFFEGFGCVFTEAFACGVPYLCCTGQGISELTSAEWMFPPGDVEMLAQKIFWVLHEHPQQTLSGEWRIDPLVSDFIKKLGV